MMIAQHLLLKTSQTPGRCNGPDLMWPQHWMGYKPGWCPSSLYSTATTSICDQTNTSCINYYYLYYNWIWPYTIVHYPNLSQPALVHHLELVTWVCCAHERPHLWIWHRLINDIFCLYSATVSERIDSNTMERYFDNVWKFWINPVR